MIARFTTEVALAHSIAKFDDTSMLSPDQYELIDMGGGRKLERFGSVVLDRPSLAAGDFLRVAPNDWRLATARFQRTSAEQGEWQALDTSNGMWPVERWTIAHGDVTLELKPTPFGHVGVFVEQAANWDWIAACVRRAARPVKLLNLFAYTGGSTLAAAAAGAEVVHVDAAANVVAWARRNAQLSDLADAAIRWIAEDALKFVKREVRRGNRYDGVILDPPSYGHGPKGETWQLGRDLPELMYHALTLTDPERHLLLVTNHSMSLGTPEVRTFVQRAGGRDEVGVEFGDMEIRDRAGRQLHSGWFMRRCSW